MWRLAEGRGMWLSSSGACIYLQGHENANVEEDGRRRRENLLTGHVGEGLQKEPKIGWAN